MHEPEPIVETPRVPRPQIETFEDEETPAADRAPAPVREGLPPGFRMRADAHYVDQLDTRMSSIPVRLIDTQAIEAGYQSGESPTPAFVESIKRLGVLQPLLVTAYGSRYRVIAGRRRLAAAVSAGLRDVPCLVQHVDSEHAEQMALATNLPATRPRPAAQPSAGGQNTGVVTTELAQVLSALMACADLLSASSPLSQSVAADLVKAEAARAMDLVMALRVLRDEMPMTRGRVPVRTLLAGVARTAAVERQLRGITLSVDDHAATSDVIIMKADARLLADALSALVSAAVSLVLSADAALDPLQRGTAGGPTVSLGVSHGARNTLTFTVSQTSIELPSAWLARPFDIAWPIREGASSLIRLQTARKIAHAHGGDVEVNGIEDGTAFSLVLSA